MDRADIEQLRANKDSDADTNEPQTPEIDWSLTTWEGARREQMRRWGKMSLAQMILALEEMQAIAEKLSPTGDLHNGPNPQD